jgi:hypothetical protein
MCTYVCLYVTNTSTSTNIPESVAERRRAFGVDKRHFDKIVWFHSLPFSYAGTAALLCTIHPRPPNPIHQHPPSLLQSTHCRFSPPATSRLSLPLAEAYLRSAPPHPEA